MSLLIQRASVCFGHCYLFLVVFIRGRQSLFTSNIIILMLFGCSKDIRQMEITPLITLFWSYPQSFYSSSCDLIVFCTTIKLIILSLGFVSKQPLIFCVS